MTTRRTLSLSTWLAFAAALGACAALAQDPPDSDTGITQTAARISYLDGDVSFARGDDPDTWQGADRNVPMTLGDRVYTGRGSRLELELNGGDVVRLAAGSDLTALNLTEDTRQFALKSGIAFFRVPDLQPDELFEVDTPNTAVTFEGSGDYRLDVDEDGNTRLSVHKGSATVAAGGGQVSVGAGAGIRVEGLDTPRYEVIGLPEVDEWDRWAGERESRVLRARSRQYVSASVAGVADLDDYGQWSQLPEYGWVWSPASVSAGWAPYRAGRWIWQDPWGWTWVSTEPWGWAPYHSGRWVFASSRWCWVPVAPAIRVVHYAPALVAFVGGGPGFSASVTIGGGFVGWFPLAPRDPLLPWWGYRDAVRVTQVANVTYVNQTYVTVVNQNTFVSGRPVSSGVITERTVVRQASAAPVLRGPVPVAPTVGSTRVSTAQRGAAATPGTSRRGPAGRRARRAAAGSPALRGKARDHSPERRSARPGVRDVGIGRASRGGGRKARGVPGGEGHPRGARRHDADDGPADRAHRSAEGPGSGDGGAFGGRALRAAAALASVRTGRRAAIRPASRREPKAAPPAARENRESRAPDTRPQAGRPTPREADEPGHAPHAAPRAANPPPEHKAERSARPPETKEPPNATAPNRQPDHATARPPADSSEARPQAPRAPVSPGPKDKPQTGKNNGRDKAHAHPAPRPTPPPS